MPMPPGRAEPASAQVPPAPEPTTTGDTLPLPRGGLLDRDWRKALVVLLTLLAALALVWVAVQIIRPILRTLLLFGLSGVLAFVLAAPLEALAGRRCSCCRRPSLTSRASG